MPTVKVSITYASSLLSLSLQLLHLLFINLLIVYYPGCSFLFDFYIVHSAKIPNASPSQIFYHSWNLSGTISGILDSRLSNHIDILHNSLNPRAFIDLSLYFVSINSIRFHVPLLHLYRFVHVVYVQYFIC